MDNTAFLISRIKPVQEKTKIEKVKMMQKILCMSSSQTNSQTKEFIDDKYKHELENCNINRLIIPLVLIAEDKK